MPSTTVYVTDEIDATTNRPVMQWIWDFPEPEAPELGTAIQCKATWKAQYVPDESQDLTGAVTSWAKPTQSATTNAPELVIGASLKLPRRHYRGTVEVELSWTAKRTGVTMSLPHVETVGNTLNGQQALSLGTPTPILSQALVAPLTPEEIQATHTASGEPTDPAVVHNYRGNLIHEALAGIYGRLRDGLGPIWRGMGVQSRTTDGTKALSESDEGELDSLTFEQLNECWAQLIAELLVGTCYHGPGAHMALTPWPTGYGKDGHRRDARFFRYVAMRGKGQVIGVPTDPKDPDPVTGSTEPEYITSLCHACQQLATATLMSRSSDFLELGENPLDCREPNQAGQLNGKTTFIAGDPSQVIARPSGTTLRDRGWLVPGACYFRPQSNNHVGVVLRAFQSTKIQMLDTEAWHFYPTPFPKPAADPADNAYPQVNFDTSARPQLPEDLNGVLIPPTVSKAKLVEAIKLLRKARPLGCVRLAIYRRGVPASKDNILYVSRKLFMHEEVRPVYRAYSVAALFNSLRACPHADRLDVRWQIFRPLGTDSVRQACNVGRTMEWWASSAGKTSCNPTIELAVSASGSPRFEQRNAQYVKRAVSFDRALDPLESVSSSAEIAAQRTAGYTSIANVDNATVPSYFKKP